MSPLTEDDPDTYFVRQPSTEAELEQAIAATEVCCVDAVRYAVTDPAILRRLHPDVCDFRITASGDVVRQFTPPTMPDDRIERDGGRIG